MSVKWERLLDVRGPSGLKLHPLPWGACECCDGHLVSRPDELAAFASHFGFERIARPLLMWGDDWSRFFEGRRVNSPCDSVDEIPHRLLRYSRMFRDAGDTLRVLAAYPDNNELLWDDMARWCHDRGAVLVDYGTERSWHEWEYRDGLVVAVGIGMYRRDRGLFESYGALRTSEGLFGEKAPDGDGEEGEQGWQT